MPLGISLGKKKQKTTTDQTQTQDEFQSGAQASTQVGTQTGTQTSTGTTSQQQSGTQSQTQSGTQSTSGQLFSDEVLGNLESTVNNLLGSVGGSSSAGSSLLSTAIDRAGNFDPSAFVNSIMTEAENQINNQTATRVAQLTDSFGGTPSSNSAAALLTNQLENNSAAQLAGISADAQAKAAEIQNQNLQTIAGAQGALSGENLVAQLLATLRGGTSTQTTTGQETQQATTAQQTTGQATEEQTSEQQTTQQALQILQQLLSGTKTLTGTEVAKGKNAGLGLGLG